MKIEKLSNKNEKFTIFIIGLVIGVGLIIIINLLTSKSKFKAEDNIDLAEGTINYIIPDLKLMAIYVKEGNEFVKKEDVPSDTTYQVIKDNTDNSSYCVDPNGNKLDNVYMKYENGALDIKVTKKGTKCWVYLEKAKLLNKDILTKNTPKESTYNETYPYIAEFTSTSTTDEGVFKMVDYDGEETYYFRGAVTDNYVHFANFYWRIIRINSDGSIRMIYDGTSAHENGNDGDGTDRQLDETSTHNTNHNDAKFVGLKFGGIDSTAESNSYEEANTNTHNSDILTVLENWYVKNLIDYDSYIEKNAVFCNDRRSINNSEDFWTEWLAAGAKNQEKSGYGQNATSYGAWFRVHSNRPGRLGFQSTQLADLSCQPNDRFTPRDAAKGNKATKYPIGLITLDEFLMAGGFGGQTSDKYYLYTGQNYWTMSPGDFNIGDGSAHVWRIRNDGNVDSAASDEVLGVRPVINLKANTTVSIDSLGTKDSPYEVI